MAREITNINNFNLQEDLPNDFLKAVQFFTLLDLVSDGAEIEGFATPSKNSTSLPSTLLSPSTSTDPQILAAERTYIQQAQQDIFLDGRVIRSSTGVENIPNTSLAIRTGTDPQEFMGGINELRIANPPTVNLTPATVHNIDPAGVNNSTNNAEANKITGTVNAGSGVNNTPRAVIVTLRWNSLRQIGADDGSSVPLGIQPNAHFTNGASGNVHIKIRMRDKNGNEILKSDGTSTSIEDQINGVSIGTYSKDYRIDIPFDKYVTATARSNTYPISVDVLRLDAEFRASFLTAGASHPFADSGLNIYEEGEKRFTAFTFAGLQAVLPQIATITEFPKSAYIGFRYSAEQFPNIPQRKYFIRGIKVKIPHNSTVELATGRLTFSGSFNGTFKTDKAWTSDPAWILYALITEDYGLQIDEATIDKASFYAASEYCSELISSPNGQIPRYSFNGVIKTRKKGLTVIKEVAGVMRASLYYKNGSLKIALDKPDTVTSYLFTNANVVDGAFNYSGTDKDKKFTQVNVSYFNNDIQELDQISVRSSQSLIDKYGLNQTNIQALYTTNKYQAQRFGRSILYNSNFESEIVTFECGLEAASILEPLMVIKIADRLKETIRASGRINAVTSSTEVVVDDSTETTVGIAGDSFLIIDINGGVQEKTIQSVSGSTVTLSSALSPLPQVGTIWAVKTGNVQHRKFRITNIKQKDNFVFSITAIVYDDNKYTFIDDLSNSVGIGRPSTTLLDPLDAPEIQELKEELIVVNSRATSRIVLNIGLVNGAKKYQVSYKLNGGSPVVENILTNQFILLNNKEGVYDFSVRSIDSLNRLSTSIADQSLTAVGLSAAPSNVSNLRFEESGDDLILKFDRSTDKDVLFGGKVKVKYALTSDGTATPQNANLLREVDGNFDQITINDYQSGEYFLTFVDVADNESVTPTSVVINRTITSGNKLAAQIREHTNNFAGSKVNTVYDSSISGLRLETGYTTGSYTFASHSNSIDLGDSFRLHLEPHFKKSGFNTATQWDSFTDNIDDWPESNFTGSGTVDKSADLIFKVAKSTTSSTNISAVYTQSGTTVTITSNTHGRSVGDTIIFDATSGAGVDGTYVITSISTNTFTFTSSTSQTITTSNCTFQYFETFANTDIIARTLSFKIDIQNASTYENVDIEELGVDIIFRPRTERSIDNSSATNGVLTSSGSGATTVFFNKKFFTGTTIVGGSTTVFKPVVSININDMQDRDFFTITSVTSTQFVVNIKNGATGGFVAREFTYSAFGYGEG